MNRQEQESKMQSISTNFKLDYELANLTPRELSEQIIGRLEKNFKVTLLPIFETDGLTERQKIARFKNELLSGIFQRAESENLQEFFITPPDIPSSVERDYLRSLQGNVGPNDDEIELEPNIALTEADTKVIKGLRGDDLKNYLFTLTKRFENMANAKTAGQLVAEEIGGGIVAVGVPAAIGTIKALRAGEKLLAAMRTGITSIGLKTAIVAVVSVLVGLLLFLFLDNPKKVLGMVINQTTENFAVKKFRKETGDLFMESGEMKNFMEDNEDGLDSAKIQIKEMLNFGEGDEDNISFAGIYFADKKFGLFGAEGVMVFSSTASDLRFAHMFASPYNKDNGTNMKLVSGTESLDLSELYDDLFDSRRQRVVKDEENFVLASTVNDARGGIVGCIASIKAKA